MRSCKAKCCSVCPVYACRCVARCVCVYVCWLYVNHRAVLRRFPQTLNPRAGRPFITRRFFLNWCLTFNPDAAFQRPPTSVRPMFAGTPLSRRSPPPPPHPAVKQSVARRNAFNSAVCVTCGFPRSSVGPAAACSRWRSMTALGQVSSCPVFASRPKRTSNCDCYLE